MSLEKVFFGFFILLALTLNFGFVLGEFDNPDHHNTLELLAVIIVNLVATVLKFGDRTQTGALLLASSLVADLQLFAAAVVWTYAIHIHTGGMDAMFMASIVSLAAGALLANIVSVVLVIIDTVNLRR
ncbi:MULTISPECIES: DUF6394 family protein [Ectothiorhodospira]|uniref:Uncharacterized protein n=1 Tax=Ectothiorhodospira marina TaxID=1396821 RepID=A0A1H7MHN3_9GAMM|nr:DUF6394 family protein [Ectothiorhodospira marina]MCG5514642.1 DUF6394 family protein [Ectothiorhodospira sp. 9100]MCG5517984.1 DUF6394 family protein [Ectothiorhodospira sp. 9905]SEL10418.1 hypothetical protein SAMN05444515_10997 [Ectothiorhodospira marina]